MRIYVAKNNRQFEFFEETKVLETLDGDRLSAGIFIGFAENLPFENLPFNAGSTMTKKGER